MDLEASTQSSAKKIKVLEPEKGWKSVLIAWMAITFALFAGALTGPVFKYLSQHGVRPCLSASWRCQCMLIFLAPLAIFEIHYDPKNKVDWFEKKPDLRYSVLVHTIISGLAWSGFVLCWIVGLQYTTTFLSAVLACTHPLILVIVYKLQGTHVSRLELLGVFVAFGGMIISCAQDLFRGTSIESSTVQSQPFLQFDIVQQCFGYCLCLMAACSEVLVLFNRIATKKYVPLFQYTFATTFVVGIVATTVSLVLESNGWIYSPQILETNTGIDIFCRENNCIFGWTSQQWVKRMLLFGFVNGVFCIGGFNYSVS